MTREELEVLHPVVDVGVLVAALDQGGHLAPMQPSAVCCAAILCTAGEAVLRDGVGWAASWASMGALPSVLGSISISNLLTRTGRKKPVPVE